MGGQVSTDNLTEKIHTTTELPTTSEEHPTTSALPTTLTDEIEPESSDDTDNIREKKSLFENLV